MIRYLPGPSKATASSTAEIIRFFQGELESGSAIRGINLNYTGTALDNDALVGVTLKAGGSDIIRLLEAQWRAWLATLGKKAELSASGAYSELPLNWGSPLAAAPRDKKLQLEVETDGTATGAGTINVQYVTDNASPADRYPMFLTNASGITGSGDNQTYAIDQDGFLRGIMIDTTNLTALKLQVNAETVWDFPSLNALLASQELISGTTVTTNKLLVLDTPIPIVPGTIKLKINASGAIGQIATWSEVPYAA